MAKIQIEPPDGLHHTIKKMLLERQVRGGKITLKELYNEIIRRGVSEMKQGKQEG